MNIWYESIEKVLVLDISSILYDIFEVYENIDFFYSHGKWPILNTIDLFENYLNLNRRIDWRTEYLLFFTIFLSCLF